MKTDLISRYVWLLNTIYEAGDDGITFDDIDQKWQRDFELSNGECYPKRTFEFHRQNIETSLGIDIECDRRTNRYRISDRDDFKNQKLTTKWIIETFSLQNIIKQSRGLHDRIGLEDIPSGSKFLVSIVDAMNKGVTFDMEYQSFVDSEAKTYKDMEAYGLQISQLRWYVVARNPEKNHVHIYSLDRIQSLTIGSKKFSVPDDFSVRDFFSSCFGIIINDATKPEMVLLKTTKLQAQYMKTLPFHESQKVVSEDKDSTTFSFFIRPTIDLKQKIFSFADRIEVIEPKWLRDEIREDLKRMVKMYK